MGCFQCWRGLAGGLYTVDRGWHRALPLGGIAAPTGSSNPALTFRGYTGLNGVLPCRWVDSGLRRLKWLWCVLVGACFLTGRGAAVAALLGGVSASVRAGT